MPLSAELALRGLEGGQQQEMEAEGMRGGESQGPEQPIALGHWAQTPSYSLSSPTLLVTTSRHGGTKASPASHTVSTGPLKRGKKHKP